MRRWLPTSRNFWQRLPNGSREASRHRDKRCRMVRPGRFGAVTKPPGPGCRLRGSAVVRANTESRIPNPGFRGNAMALNLTQKQEVVAELAEVAGSAHSLVAAEYVALTVAQLTDMLKKSR